MGEKDLIEVYLKRIGKLFLVEVEASTQGVFGINASGKGKKKEWKRMGF